MVIENVEGFSVCCIHLSEVDSTNSYLRREAAALFSRCPSCDVFVVTADVQSAGRGQRGSVWQSAAGDNLLASFLLRPSMVPVSRSYSLSVAAALALGNCMSHYGISTLLKWPNDLYSGNAKLAGILLETDCEGMCLSQAVLGIGLNVNQKVFGSMERNPVSMSLLCGRDFSVSEVCRRLVFEFLRLYRIFLAGDDDALFAEYEQALMGRHSTMLYRDACGTFEAAVDGVCKDGRIRLLRSDGTLSLYSFKEVSVVTLGY